MHAHVIRPAAAPLALLVLLLSACGDGAPAAQDGARACVLPPALSAPPADLDAALVCHGPIAAGRAPLLLVPGTTLTPEANYDWNWRPALEALDWPHCTVALPARAMGDVQLAAEYVVHAVRSLHARSGRRVQILGYSQGGMLPRWALKYWPDIRPMVEELVGLSPSNHGTLSAEASCQTGCAPAYWQQKHDARFIAALNADFETLEGIDYSSIYTWADEVVTPNTPPAPSSALAGGDRVVNVALQEVCPNNLADHLAIGSYDAVAYALAIDALAHPGPVDPARIPLSVCASPLMPGVDPAGFAADYAAMLQFIARTQAEAETLPEEPPLRCYAAG